MLTNFDDPNPNSLVITELESEKLLSDNIRNVLNEYTNISVSYVLTINIYIYKLFVHTD